MSLSSTESTSNASSTDEAVGLNMPDLKDGESTAKSLSEGTPPIGDGNLDAEDMS